jgi:hypothetical protein
MISLSKKKKSVIDENVSFICINGNITISHEIVLNASKFSK